MSTNGIVALNNYLQSKNQESSLSWVNSTSGVPHAPTWTSICKINGEPRGVGTATHKHVAQGIAATEALKALEAEST